jgi:hypothetical protein
MTARILAADERENLEIQPIVIPRRYDSAQGRLHFCVVFSFLRRVGDDYQPRGRRGVDPVKVPACLCNPVEPWPSFIARLFRDKQCQLVVSLDGADEKRTRNIQLETFRDLAASGWTKAKADELWNTLILPAAQETNSASAQPMNAVSLRRMFADRRREIDPEKLYADAAAEPWAASDLRPGTRIESLNSPLVAAEIETFNAGGGSEPQQESFEDLRKKFQQRDPTSFREFLDFLKHRDPAADLGPLAVSIHRADPRFEELILPELRRQPSFAAQLDQLFAYEREFSLLPSQTEIRRQGRFILSSRNRSIPVATAAAPVAAGPDGAVSLVLQDAAGPQENDHLSFERRIAMVRQHPGLARRAYLTLSCSVDLSELSLGPLSLKQLGEISLDIPPDGANPAGFEDGAFLSVLSKTLFELRRKDLMTGQGWDSFRPAPRERESFYGTAEGGEEAFHRHHVLAPQLYQATQDDPSIAMARADKGLTDPRGPKQTPAAAAREELHPVNSVNFFSRPRTKEGTPTTVARQLVSTIRSNTEALVAFNHHVNQYFAALRAERAGLQFVGARFESATLRKLAPPLFSAENLIAGNSVFVQPVQSGRPPRWHSLCRRQVQLTVSKHDADQHPYQLTFEEEGFLAKSIVVPPRPITGKAVGAEFSPADKQLNFNVDILGPKNTLAPPGEVPNQFAADEKTRFNNLLESSTGLASPLKTGDVVLVTSNDAEPAAGKRQKCSEIAVHPIFHVPGNPLQPLVKDELVNFTRPLLLAARNALPDGTTPRPEALLPLLIAPQSTRFLNTVGEAICPRAIKNLPTTGPTAAEYPDNFTHFLVEGSRRIFGNVNSGTLAAVIPQFEQETDKLGKFVFTNLGSATSVTVGQIGEKHITWRLLPRPDILPESASDDAFAPIEPGRLDLFAFHSGPPLHMVRGRVHRIDFALNLSVKRNPAPAAGRVVVFGNDPEDKFEMSVPLAPTNTKYEINPPVFDKIALPKGPQGAPISVTVTGYVKFPDAAGEVNITLVAEAVEVATGPTNLEATAGKVQWMLWLEKIDGGLVRAKFDLGQAAPPAPAGRFVHPLETLPPATKGEFVEVLTYEPRGLIQALGWPQRLHGTLAVVDAAAGKHAIRFADGMTLPCAPGDVAAPKTGFFVVTKEGDLPTVKGIAEQNLIIAGELITKRKEKKDDDEFLNLELADPAGQSWTLLDPPDIKLHTSNSRQSVRSIRDLQLGEWLLASCELTVDSRSSARRQIGVHAAPAADGQPAVALADALLVGRFKAPETPALRAAAEGGVTFRLCDFRSQAGREIPVWSNARQNDQPQDLVVPSLQVVLGETLTQYAEPAPAEMAMARFVSVDGEVVLAEPAQDPVHVIMSELICRWSNWSVTTPLPGANDRNPAQAENQIDKRVKVELGRPDLGQIVSPSPYFNRESWLLPALRFDRDYKFCVRRVDLAGNHYYDEELLDPGLTAVAHLEKLSRQSAGASQRAFRRTNPAVAPLAAFPPDRPEPTYVKAVSPADRQPPKELTVDPQVAGKFSFLSFKGREPQLILCTDVLNPARCLADDAFLDVLPPPCDVELALLHGLFDGKSPADVARLIGAHEGYVEDKVLGFLQAANQLNYLPDPLASQLSIALKDEAYPSAYGWPREVELLLKGNWPAIRWVRLYLQSTGRKANVYPDQLPILPPQIAVDDRSPAKSSLTVRLSPGVVSEAVLSVGPPAAEQASAGSVQSYGSPSRSIKLIHATNGAWTRPVWTKLKEQLPGSLTAVSTNRPMAAELQIDRLTTGACSATAYWNDPWDESVEAQHEPAHVVVEMDQLGKPVHAHLLSPGFGFGTKEAVLFETEGMPHREPKLVANLHHHTLKSFTILDPGAGCEVVFHIRVVPANPYPGSRWKAAVAVAWHARGGELKIDIKDRGECLGPDVLVLIEARQSPFPALKVTIADKAVAKVELPDPPYAWYSRDLHARIIRRPPFYRVAEARVREFSPGGGLRSIEVLDGGGWYHTTPFCVAHDSHGDGFGAVLKARLNGQGSVCRIDVVQSGRRYSDRTRIGLYTNEFAIPERTVDSIPSDPTANLIDFSFMHDCDSRARRVDYVARATTRFQQFLRDEPDDNEQGPVDPYDPTIPDTIRRHVPRFSPVQQVEITSQGRPEKPDVAYLMAAFRWKVVEPANQAAVSPAEFFMSQRTGLLHLVREAVVRVYLHRPWNQTGPEQLAVVVAPATLNTVLSTDTPDLNPGDGGAFNPAGLPNAGVEHPGYDLDPVSGYAIDDSLRRLVSRWGYDPVWNEESYPPLSLDHFSDRRKTSPIYDQLSEIDTTSSLNVTHTRPVWIAPHEVHYDSAKDLWYADIAIDISAGGAGVSSLPFVRLSLATYQPHGVPGKRLSPVTICDMYKLIGKRELQVARLSETGFKLNLSGEFDHAPQPGQFPRREVLARVEARDPSLAPEVVHYVPSEDPRGPLPPTTKVVAQFALRRFKSGYSKRIELSREAWEAARLLHGRPSQAVLSIVENEIYPCAESQTDSTGAEALILDGRLCARKLVYSTTFRIEPVAKG